MKKINKDNKTDNTEKLDNKKINIEDSIDKKTDKENKTIEEKNSEEVTTKDKRKFIKKLIIILTIIFIIFLIYRVFSYFSWKNLALPMMKNQCSIVVDANGNIIEKLGAEKKQQNVDLSDIPENLKNAYIDIEDERFFSHKGIDIKRTGAAIGSYISNGGKSSFGASTITQQLVKNLTGNTKNLIPRKIEEWVKSVELETFSSKDDILEAYFNIIYVAPNTYGVSMGAKYYFSKDLKDLSLAECAFLAGINHSPNSYNPFKEKDNDEKIKSRTKTVLTKMLELNHINQDEYNMAVQELENGLAFNNGQIEPENDGIYSYHTDAVISEVVSEIADKKNISTEFATNYIYMAGLTIHSTEKIDIQEKLENEYNKNKYSITSETGQKSQSAMVVIDQSNGHVVGCVGALGEKTVARGFNRATQGVRQTGSAMKPIAVLVPGIDKKLFTAATIYNDEQTIFYDNNKKEYSPSNNDNYIGKITVRRAVESSQNIPFVKMMGIITPKISINYLEKMGITTLTEKDENLSLALGGLDKGITPLEMAAAYATIANDGEYIEPTFYTKIENSEGEIILKTKQNKTTVFSKEVACILKQILKQPVEGTNGTAKQCKIEGIDVAAKTGTTNENYDKWLCGFTTYYTAVTWYGYDINETLSYKGESPAILLWSAVMKDIHSNLDKAKFDINENVEQSEICAKTGETANTNCTETYTEYFLSGTVPSQCVGCSSTKK
ncbi:MAG: transglycosylase domain-containing protein [Clostridia bacterium]|nr:transglycosylase domain-containing protein [Clostridia bacterium]